MPLIRICDHFKDNPKRIDKLIAIKGLPREWMFRDTPEGVEIKKPWEPDIDANIPMDIRHLCEPMYIIQRFQPLNNQSKEILEKRQILGIKIDYNNEPGRQMWDDVERFIEGTIPRNERIPVPVLCARDERSAFDTYAPRRNSRGSLELIPAPIPLVDLTKYIEIKSEVISSPREEKVLEGLKSLVQDVSQQASFKCEECDYHHASQQGIRMHKVKRHPKQKVGAT